MLIVYNGVHLLCFAEPLGGNAWYLDIKQLPCLLLAIVTGRRLRVYAAALQESTIDKLDTAYTDQSADPAYIATRPSQLTQPTQPPEQAS